MDDASLLQAFKPIVRDDRDCLELSQTSRYIICGKHLGWLGYELEAPQFWRLPGLTVFYICLHAAPVVTFAL